MSEVSDKDKKTVEEITEYIMRKLKDKYGYCGMASNPDFAMLNSGDGNIVVKIYTDM